MMKKFYHLGTCSTCQRIMKTLELGPEVILQDIRTDPITVTQLDEMKERSGSYESLFSRRAMKYRSMGLHERSLDEGDYKSLILEEYTFLKRPVLILDDQIFVGNSKKEVNSAKNALNS